MAPFMIAFVTRTTIKSQALAEFVADWTSQAEALDEAPLDPVWIMYCDKA